LLPQGHAMNTLPDLGRSGSWICTSPGGTVREFFNRTNAERAANAGWRIETALVYLGRINQEIRAAGP
jgi:hypothetical protein